MALPETATSPLEKAVAEMRAAVANRKVETFALPDNRFHKHARRRDELASRRGIKRLVRPANAADLIDTLPAPGEITHAILRGNFVLGDALPGILAKVGRCPHLIIATLALSTRNAETLRELVASGAAGKLTLICSHYFRAVDKLSTFHAVSQILGSLGDVAVIKIARCHAKVMLIANEHGDAFVFEGSANLRSSDTIEQLTVFNDPELLAFHEAWIAALESQPMKAVRESVTAG